MLGLTTNQFPIEIIQPFCFLNQYRCFCLLFLFNSLFFPKSKLRLRLTFEYVRYMSQMSDQSSTKSKQTKKRISYIDKSNQRILEQFACLARNDQHLFFGHSGEKIPKQEKIRSKSKWKNIYKKCKECVNETNEQRKKKKYTPISETFGWVEPIVKRWNVMRGYIRVLKLREWNSTNFTEKGKKLRVK